VPTLYLLFQIRAFPAAEKSCSQVLQVDPDNVKALFRKGKVGSTEFQQYTVGDGLISHIIVVEAHYSPLLLPKIGLNLTENSLISRSNSTGI